jgi:hypothetical protein
MSDPDAYLKAFASGWFDNAFARAENRLLFVPAHQREEGYDRGVRLEQDAWIAAEAIEHARLELAAAPPIDDMEIEMLLNHKHVLAAGHYSQRTGIRLSLASRIVGEYDGQRAAR